MDFFERIGSFDRRWIFLGLFISIAIPILIPIGLPITISKPSQATFDFIEELEPGSVISIGFDSTLASMQAEQGAISYALTLHIFEKPFKVIFYGLQPDAAPITKMILDNLEKEGILEEKIYGEDYVVLGYIPGLETGLSAFAADIRSIIKTDDFGTDINTIPMMDDIHNINDIDLAIGVSGTMVGPDAYVRQLYTIYNTKLIFGPHGLSIPNVIPYYQANQIVSYIPGMTGAAEYESLTNTPREALKSMDAISIGFSYTIIVIIVCNISYWGSKMQKGGV